MNPEIEELRKFAKIPITKARLGKLRAALSNAATLFERLEPKPDDKDAAADFESGKSNLESALDELESACDDLESAEGPDEREDAKEQISSSLEDALNYFDEIMPVAVLGDPADVKVRDDFNAEFKAKQVEISSAPKEQRATLLTDWIGKWTASASTAEENQRRAAYISKLLKKNKKPPEAEQSPPSP
jgi:Asp-tRNA(Asn)/Glu-tRNA(Gln) amidotransferase C subunit